MLANTSTINSQWWIIIRVFKRLFGGAPRCTFQFQTHLLWGHFLNPFVLLGRAKRFQNQMRIEFINTVNCLIINARNHLQFYIVTFLWEKTMWPYNTPAQFVAMCALASKIHLYFRSLPILFDLFQILFQINNHDDLALFFSTDAGLRPKLVGLSGHIRRDQSRRRAHACSDASWRVGSVGTSKRWPPQADWNLSSAFS